jgi:hypothetical protein
VIDSRLLRRAASAWPGTATPSRELERAVQFLQLGREETGVVTASAVVEAGYLLGVVASVASALGLGLLGTRVDVPTVALVAVPAAVGLLFTQVVHSAPVWLATFQRTRALGSVAGVVGLLALRLRLSPTPERAAQFAGNVREGPLAASLARHAAAADGRPDAGLIAWAEAWQSWFPALDRAVALLVASVDAPPASRERTLDRAVETVGDAVESRAAAFASQIRGPVTGLYAVGVLLPFALVGAVPAAAVTGLPVTPTTFVLTYDVLLPVGVAVAGGRILLTRPVAFPPPSVPRDHPEIPDRRRRTVVATLAGGAVGWIVAERVVAAWAGPLAAVGTAVGTGLIVWFHPAGTVRERVRELERGLPDALALVGRSVADGESVEAAVAGAATDLPGPVGTAFDRATRRRRRLRVDVERAFCGDHGPFVETPTPAGRAVAVLLGVTAETGQPAGSVLLDEAERLDTLRDHEQRARRSVATVTDTLSNTAAVFGPLVGGATVAMASHLDGVDATALAGEGAALSTPLLGTAVGTYVLLLAVLLPALASTLRAGVDPVLVGSRVGRTLLSATATFLLGVWATGLLV